MISNPPEVSNFNWLFLKLNQFICNQPPVFPEHRKSLCYKQLTTYGLPIISKESYKFQICACQRLLSRIKDAKQGQMIYAIKKLTFCSIVFEEIHFPTSYASYSFQNTHYSCKINFCIREICRSCCTVHYNAMNVQ